jgi:hypothetical protein
VAELTAPELTARGEISLGRWAMVTPVILLILFNGADIALTHIALGLGAVESNPLASALMGGGRVELLKFGLLCALALRSLRRRPTLRFTVACWAAAGAYAMVVLSNLYVVLSIH